MSKLPALKKLQWRATQTARRRTVGGNVSLGMTFAASSFTRAMSRSEGTNQEMTMKRLIAFTLGTALAGGMAFAQDQDQQTDPQSEYGDEVGEWSDQDRMGQTEMQDQSTYGEEMSSGLADMSVEELQGKTVVTESGEEVGEIGMVGHSQQHQERVATVDVGGFLGVAEKTIAIPLSELKMSSDGNIVTSLTKETIQSTEDFDEQGFTEEEGDDSTY